jgi:hypothetical protein
MATVLANTNVSHPLFTSPVSPQDLGPLLEQFPNSLVFNW